MTRSEVSDSNSKQIDESVRVMVKDCYKETYSLVSKNREAMDKIVDILIEKETLDGNEFVRYYPNNFYPQKRKDTSITQLIFSNLGFFYLVPSLSTHIKPASCGDMKKSLSVSSFIVS
ncbi:MAG: hypothetical protein Ct9H90mP22_6000 [Gammaproteobacteria bacterium]|nr:MAG: hypothetical protein Ct9H90mP22_6000 [Gammaproteobacteria bacterium]